LFLSRLIDLPRDRCADSFCARLISSPCLVPIVSVFFLLVSLHDLCLRGIHSGFGHVSLTPSSTFLADSMMLRLTLFVALALSVAGTTAPTARTSAPTSAAPTARTTAPVTTAPTSASPSAGPITRGPLTGGKTYAPTASPTTTAPTSASPSAGPITRGPLTDGKTYAPSTAPPTRGPLTGGKTYAPTKSTVYTSPTTPFSSSNRVAPTLIAVVSLLVVLVM
jgi:hypothetical protein